jgi:predicted phage-related endonuclease
VRIIKYVLRVRISERVEKGGRIKDTQAEADHIKTGGTMRAQFITASEVAEIMGISRSKAYQIVREKSQGYLTVAGKCPAQYFKQKFYGFQIPGGERNDGK